MFVPLKVLNLDNKKEIETNPMIIEMNDMLQRYRKEVENNITHKVPIDFPQFKKSFYPQLDKLLNQLSLIKSKELRKSKAEIVYKWYEKKLKAFNDLKKIDVKTFTIKKNAQKINLDKPNTYIAENYPTHYERENRTEFEGLLPPKDRLKSFTSKHVNTKSSTGVTNKEAPPKLQQQDRPQTNNKDKNRLYSANDKQRISSAASSTVLRSTQYTNMYTSSTKFFKPSNNNEIKTNIVDPIREIKSSYTYSRPEYSTSNLVIENMVLKEKNKEVAEKRNMEERKEFMNEWAINKARMKEDVERKAELKKLLKVYEEEERQRIELEKRLNLEKITEENKETIIDMEEDKNDDENGTEEQGSINENKYTKESGNTLSSFAKRNSSELNNTESNNQDESKYNESSENYMKIEDSNYQQNTDNDNNNENSKINNNNENAEANKKFIITENKIITDNNAPSFTLNKTLKVNLDSKFIKAINQFKDTENFPSEHIITTRHHDRVFKTRHEFSSLLNIKLIDNPKVNYKNIYDPLSAYDNANIEVMSISAPSTADSKTTKQRPATAFHFMVQRWDNENLLKNRLQLSSFQNEDMSRFHENLNEDKKIPLIRLKSAFLPPCDRINQSKFYLPIPGAGLLNKVHEDKPKKAKRPKSKKR